MIDTIIQVLVFGGLQNGAIFALVGLGLALVYKATKVLNFAQGEMGTIPAFVAYLVMTGFDTGDFVEFNRAMFIPATLIAIAAGAILGVALYAVVIRQLASASPVTTLVATAGVTLLATSVQVNVFEAKVRPFPRPIEGTFRLVGTDVRITYHALVILAVLVIVTIALALFFRSPIGVALLATAQDPYAAELQGVPVELMRALAWGAAGGLAGIAGVLAAGYATFQPGMMTALFLIPAFTGVVLGGIDSMIGAVVGGFTLGIVSQLAVELVNQFNLQEQIKGEPQLAVFLVLLVVLVLRPRGLFGARA